MTDADARRESDDLWRDFARAERRAEIARLRREAIEVLRVVQGRDDIHPLLKMLMASVGRAILNGHITAATYREIKQLERIAEQL